ncbi:MAG: KpsF/GutQ family sugar-phosphate isomerase [Sandaracinaceae bacterium]|nr:KpsF/GutQ family sugar-phosphate isomerase [Sandaracinaceae bacterium]
MRMDATARRHDSNVLVLPTGAIDPLASQARDCLRQLAATIARLSTRVDERFSQAVRQLYSIDGHVVVTGLGKSGLVGRKIAATFASTGTPSFFVHSAEAMHGDLGMITDDDAVLLISYSGETPEVVSLLPHLRRRRIPMVALVGNLDSSLARGVDVAVDVSVEGEIDPNNLAPTSSTLAALAMGDALAVSLTKLRGFHEEDFARLHPGGMLGRRLMCVGDLVARDGVCLVSPEAPLSECVLGLARSRLPLALVRDGAQLVGVVTAAEIERALRESPELLVQPVKSVMNASPPTVDPGVLAGEAELRMDHEGIDALLVVDASGEVHGVFARGGEG